MVDSFPMRSSRARQWRVDWHVGQYVVTLVGSLGVSVYFIVFALIRGALASAKSVLLRPNTDSKETRTQQVAHPSF